MTAYKRFYVTYNQMSGKWDVRDEWDVLGTHSKKKGAVKSARQLAKDEKPSELVVQKKSGFVSERTRYE